MTFKLSTSGHLYESYEEVANLEELGFTFRKTYVCGEDRIFIEGNPSIEINSLEEIIDFISKHGEIILTKDEIEIYNNSRE